MPDMPKPFSLNLSFDGNFLFADYCDGSDVESAVISSRQELESLIAEHVSTAMSPEAD